MATTTATTTTVTLRRASAIRLARAARASHDLGTATIVADDGEIVVWRTGGVTLTLDVRTGRLTHRR